MKFRNHWFAFGSSCLLCFAVFFVLEKKYLIGNFVFQDDIIFLTKYMLGLESEVTTNNYSHIILQLFSSFGSLNIIKILWVFVHALVSGFIAFYFNRKGFDPVISVFVSLLIIFVPISGDQIIFVTGSHPTLALVFLLAALILFDGGPAESRPRSLFTLLPVFLLLACSALFSATSFLAPLALPLWLILEKIHHRESEIKNMFLLVVLFTFLAGIVIFLGAGGHHYSSFVGWIDISIEQVWSNFLKALHYSLEAIFSKYLINSNFFLLSVACGLYLLFRYVSHNLKSFTPIALKIKTKGLYDNVEAALYPFFLSILVFGPISVTTSLQKRYLVAPLTLFLIAVSLLFVRVLNTKRRKAKALFFIIMFVLIVLNVFRTWRGHELYLGPFFDTHIAVSGLVQKESSVWPQNSQVVLLLSQDSRTPTDGYNHWSSWYLRLLSGRADLIGLVGKELDISRYPFLAKYEDHSPDYWEVVNGRSSRIRMIGLEKQRALFVYKQKSSGNFEMIDEVIFSGMGQGRSVLRGQSYDNGLLMSETSLDNLKKNVYVWHHTQDK